MERGDGGRVAHVGEGVFELKGRASAGKHVKDLIEAGTKRGRKLLRAAVKARGSGGGRGLDANVGGGTSGLDGSARGKKISGGDGVELLGIEWGHDGVIRWHYKDDEVGDEVRGWAAQGRLSIGSRRQERD